MAWDFYDPHEEDGNNTDLWVYFYTFSYANKPDKMKEGMTGNVMYKNRKNYSSRNHVVTAHKIIFHTLFLTRMGYQILWPMMMPNHLREVYRPLYHIGKFQLMSPLAIVQ